MLALPKLGESMSLYRAALRLARLLPLGVAIPAEFRSQLATGFADVSPVFTLQLPAKATVKSNPRPQALHYGVYMLIPSLISLPATRRAGKTCNQSSKDLTDQTLDMSSPRSCVGDPWDPAAQARAGQRALGWFLSS